MNTKTPKSPLMKERVEITVPVMIEYSDEKQREDAFARAFEVLTSHGLARVHSAKGFCIHFKP